MMTDLRDATIHEEIQFALREYMAHSNGRYPRVLEVSHEVLGNLSRCPDAMRHMRAAWLTDGGIPCEFILYLGLWLLPKSGTTRFRLVADLPITSRGKALRECPPPP
jgi:hypothetical protein